MCLGATPPWTPISTAPAARLRTCGWPRGSRASGSDGSAFSATTSCESFWAFPTTSWWLPIYASGTPRSSSTSPNCNAGGGPAACPSISWCTESAGAKRLLNTNTLIASLPGPRDAILEAIDHQLRDQQAGAHRHDDVDRCHSVPDRRAEELQRRLAAIGHLHQAARHPEQEHPWNHRDHRGETDRSEEHTSELQSRLHLVCRLLLEKKKKKPIAFYIFKKKKKKTQTNT